MCHQAVMQTKSCNTDLVFKSHVSSRSYCYANFFSEKSCNTCLMQGCNTGLMQGCTHTVLLGIFNIRLPQWTLDSQTAHWIPKTNIHNSMNIFWTSWTFVQHLLNIAQICPKFGQEHVCVAGMNMYVLQVCSACHSVAHFHDNTPRNLHERSSQAQVTLIRQHQTLMFVSYVPSEASC